MRALDRKEPAKATSNLKTFRQGRHHPYNVKQTPEEYAAPWGWRRGKVVRAIAPAAKRLAPVGLLLPPLPPHIPAPAHKIPARAPGAAPLPLPSLYLPQPGPVAPEPIARAPAQPTPPPPVRPEPAWLQQLKIDAQTRQATDVFSGMWAEMQLRLKLKNISRKAEEPKRAVPELQSDTVAQPAAEMDLAPEPASAAQLKPTVQKSLAAELQSANEAHSQPQPPIVHRPTPKPLPKRLTDEEMTRYLGLVEQNEEWVVLGLPIQPQREKWETKARKQNPDYIRFVIEQLAQRL